MHLVSRWTIRLDYLECNKNSCIPSSTGYPSSRYMLMGALKEWEHKKRKSQWEKCISQTSHTKYKKLVIGHLEMILGHDFLWACRMIHEPLNYDQIFDSHLRIKVMAPWSFPIGLYVEAMYLQCFPPTLRECALFRKRVLFGPSVCRVWPWLFYMLSGRFFSCSALEKKKTDICQVWSCDLLHTRQSTSLHCYNTFTCMASVYKTLMITALQSENETFPSIFRSTGCKLPLGVVTW